MHPGRQVSVVQASYLNASPAEVWKRATTLEGINDELRPWLRMTMPAAFRGKTIDELPTGERLGRSWLLLFGAIPVDYDDLCLAEVGPGHRFLERSRMLSMARWQHERELHAMGEGCEVVDRLTFELRTPMAAIPGFAALARGVVARLFRHRHRQLAAWFDSRR